MPKGPKIKPPPIKPPAFLSDLFQDLRERHLLPLVAILLVAIVAVPLAFGGSSGGEGEEPTPGEEEVAAAAAGGGGELVAKSAPGLRRYQRRLDNLEAKDPFEQQYAGGERAASGGNGGDASGAAGGSAGGSTATDAQPARSAGEEGSSSAPSEGTTRESRTYYSYAIDVRVTPLGEQAATKPKPTVRRGLPELTMLPSRETPAAIFVGATKDGKKALFVISSDVEAIFGDGRCVLGSRRCEMLMLEPGLPQTFVYGGAGRTFRIELLEVGLVESEKINKAPLGNPQQKSKKRTKASG